MTEEPERVPVRGMADEAERFGPCPPARPKSGGERLRGMKACKSKSTGKAKKNSKRARAIGDGEPVKLEEARKQFQQMVGANVANITEAVIEEALKGKYQPAKFLFETAGLTSEMPDEETPAEEESLTKILLNHWRIGKEDGKQAEVTKDSTEEEAEELVVP